MKWPLKFGRFHCLNEHFHWAHDFFIDAIKMLISSNFKTHCLAQFESLMFSAHGKVMVLYACSAHALCDIRKWQPNWCVVEAACCYRIFDCGGRDDCFWIWSGVVHTEFLEHGQAKLRARVTRFLSYSLDLAPPVAFRSVMNISRAR